MPLNTGGSGGGSGGASSGAIRAGGAYVELFVRDSFTKAFDRFKQKFGSLGKFVGVSVAAGGGAAAAVGASVLAPLTGAFKAAVDRGAEFQRLAKRLGATTEELSAFGYAAGTTGQSMEDLAGHWENLAERVTQAKEGTGEAVDTFRKLGIDAGKFSLKTPVEQLEELADRLNAFSSNDTVRRGALSTLFGDKGQGLNELLKKGAAGIRELKQEAADVGAVVGTEEAKNADRAWQALNRTWAAAKNTVVSVGAALLPHVGTLEELTGRVVGAARTARQWVDENKDVVASVGAVAAGLVAGGTAVAGFGGALTLAGPALSAVLAPLGLAVSVVGTLATATAAAVGPVGILAAGLAVLSHTLLTRDRVAAVGELGGALGGAARVAGRLGAAVGDALGGIGGAVRDVAGALLSSLGAALGHVWDAAVETFGGVKDTFVKTWGGVVGAVRGGDLAGAFDVAFKGLDLAWKQTLLGMKTAWAKFKDELANGTVVDDVVENAVAGSDDMRFLARSTALGLAGLMPTWLGGMSTEEMKRRYAEEEAALDARNKLLKDNLAIEQQARREAARAEAAGRIALQVKGDQAAVEDAKKALDAALSRGTFRPADLALGGGILAGVGQPGDSAKAAAEGLDKFFAKFNDLAPKVGGTTGPGFFGRWIEDGLNKLNATPSTVADSTRGAMYGPLGLQLGGGGGVAQKQLDALNVIKKNMTAENIAAAVGAANERLLSAFTLR